MMGLHYKLELGWVLLRAPNIEALKRWGCVDHRFTVRLSNFLRWMVPGETAAKITPIKDNQTAAAVDMSARDAAHHLVQKESHEL